MEQESISLEVVYPQAEGIDVGSRSHWVAVGQSKQDVREFGVFNQDLFAMAEWLKEKNVKTIAMESTGTTSTQNSLKKCSQCYWELEGFNSIERLFSKD